MTIKRAILCVAVVALFLAAGCGPSRSARNREEAKGRWAASRAEMVTKLAEGCFQRGEFGRARQHLDELIKTAVPYAPTYILAARLAAEKGELDTARLYAESARILDPKSAEAGYVLGTIEQTLGHPERALAEFNEAARLDEKEPRYALAKVEMLVAKGDIEPAAKYLSEAIGRMPGRAEVHAALGDVLSVLGRYEQAAASYRQATRLDPQQTGLRDRLAVALFYSGAYAEAEPLLAEVAASEPDFSAGWALHMRAHCLLALGRVADARALYDAQRQAKPGAAAPLVGLAKCDILDNRLPSAQKYLEAAIAKEPLHSEANALMGYVLVAAGKMGEAQPHLKLALKDPACAGRATVERLLALAGGGEAQASANAGRAGAP